ncbi:MAG: capsular polysaccharide synthesis protein [Streptosporangiaceae bacterium]
MSTGTIGKTVWFLWFQGLENAPYVVRKCHESWVVRNPGWRVVNLDEASLPRLASVDYRNGSIADLPVHHRADLLRLDLLAHHGGVWADSTCFCVQPLDGWLPPNMESGFFAFDRPGPDRVISSWFLAAQPGNILVSRLFERMLAYWGDSVFRQDERRVLRKALTSLLEHSPRTRSWWFSTAVRDLLAVSPYYALHYGFEKLVREDPECADIWRRTPRISADGPHRLYRAGLLSPGSAELRSEIDRGEVPVYKTTWKLRGQPIPDDSLLRYLLEPAHT